MLRLQGSEKITMEGGCNMPNWIMGMWMVIALVLGIAALSFTWSKCGAKTLILGNGGLAAAATGMCD